MKHLFTVMLLSMVAIGVGHSKVSWEKVRVRKGITQYKRVVPGYDYHEFYGIGPVKASLERCREIMRDVESYPKWMNACVHARHVLKEKGNTFFYYIVSDSPWPVEDRDGIYQCRETVGKDRLVYDLVTLDRPDVVPLRKKTVRMNRARVQWVFQRKGDTTLMSYRIHSHPGGNLPLSLYNSSGPDIPYNNILGFRKRVRSLSR